MARGKPWTDEEIELLTEMAAEGLSPQQIYESGKLPGRTFQAIMKEHRIAKKFGSIVQTKPATIVQTIEPAQNAMPMERVVKLFTTAFEEICKSKEVF
jgi:hypothetical protein